MFPQFQKLIDRDRPFSLKFYEKSEIMQESYPLLHHIFNIFKIGAAGICGYLLGCRFEGAGEGRGFRAPVIMAVGGCLLMVMTLHFWPGDPGFMAVGIALGGGAVSAGMVLGTHGNPAGMYGGALLWVSAVIGGAIGANLFLEGGLVTILAFWALPAFGQSAGKI